MTKAIIMGMKVGPSITDTSQSNRGTRGHHDPYPCVCMRHRGLLIAHTSQESSNRDKPDWESKQS